MNILVTGATGFIGSALISYLQKQHNNHIYCLVRSKTKIKESPSLTPIECDLSSLVDTDRLPEAMDIIVYLAQANVPFPDKANELFRVNTSSVQELLDYSYKIGAKSFVYASSGSIYGAGKRAFNETDIPHPLDYYSVTKYCSELLISRYQQYFNTVILRFFAPYGIGQTNRLIPGLIERVKTGKEITIYNEGNPRMNPIYITDVVTAIERSLALHGHHILNIGGAGVYNIKEMVEIISRLLGISPRYKMVSDESKQDLFGDITLMQTLLGYQPKISLEEGIRLMATS